MLPSPLLDLLLHRLSIPFNASINQLRTPRNVRYFQQLLTTPKPSVLSSTHRSEHIPNLDHNILPLNDQLQALTDFEVRISTEKQNPLAKLSEELPDYQVEEAQLNDIYKDLLSYPDVTKNKQDDGIQNDVDRDSLVDLLEILDERFSNMSVSPQSTTPETLSAQLIRDFASKQSIPSNNVDSKVLLSLEESTSVISASLRLLANRLQTSLQKLDTTWLPSESDETPTLSLGLLSRPEWDTLIKGALTEDDPIIAEKLLSLMKMVGEKPSEEQYDAILNWYAHRGLIEETDTFCSRLSIDLARDRQRDLLVKARIQANKLDEACKMIYSFESNATPAPIRSYTRVIRAFLFQAGPGSEQLKAQAWDMFSHMRYAAHPIPDEFLYTVMIRSLAETQDPEAERALDLFTEMTVDNQIPPTTYSYNAVILACARSKKFKLEAFRLVREMLNAYKGADGEVPSSLRPDKHTFLALLEAAKRLGDLTRTRWILTQLIKETRRIPRGGTKVTYLDESIMGHVFHAYASYKPPFHRNIAPEREEEEATEEPIDTQETHAKSLQTASPSRSHTPQTHQEVLREASALWNRILDDIESVGDDSNHDNIFSNVALTTGLVNSYMSVHFAHSPPDTAFDAFGRVYEELDIPKDARSYLVAFDTYTRGKRCTKHEMQRALEYARALWPEWLALESKGITQMLPPGKNKKQGVDSRLVEKVWKSMFRLMAHNDCLDEAINLVRDFMKRYPPSFVKEPSPVDPNRSTRVSLYAERPLVRLTERSSVPEDRIPPFLLFQDLELLHHRSVLAKRRDYIDYIKWVANAYAGALRQRQYLTFSAGSKAPSEKASRDG
ncbi:hypothetical protein Clacol_003512 [Clathrus columnatus]|uniref:Pentatricopeptide repeat-containing protein n=1 Tax=Clathrus columnatus TaxID=1419009 RepID=A0AAV5A8J9_9AGAM|nr:hypothetical protein Clacol_003512 [Clathrus columnatus]